MAEGDNRARYTNNAPIVDKELGPETVKADPIDKPRLPEDTARANAYVATGQKDILPEHRARRDRYPLITASN